MDRSPGHDPAASTRTAPRGTSASRCRVCGAANARGLATVAGYAFVECGPCGFVFAPAVDAHAADRLYASGYHGAGDGAPSKGWAWELSWLEPALARSPADRPLRILDFGTGQSRVPDVLRERGHRVVAVDVAPPIRPHPDRLTGRLEELHLPAAHFDLVYAFQVFEHLPEPRAPLFELLRVTRPGGLVLVHTDMETEERAAGFERWWYVLPPDHCAFFRHRTFDVALAGTPHRVVDRGPKHVLIEAGPAGHAAGRMDD